MDRLFKFFIEVLNTTFKNNPTFFSLLIIIIVLSGLALLINNPRIHRYLFILLLSIGIISLAFIGIDSAITLISSGKYSIQLPKCQKTARYDQFKIEIKRCNKLNRSVTFDFLITNTGKEKEFSIYARGTRIVDWFGNENEAETVLIGNRIKDSYSGTVFPNNIPIKASVTFEEVLLEKNIISLLEIKTSQTNVNFNNVILSE